MESTVQHLPVDLRNIAGHRGYLEQSRFEHCAFSAKLGRGCGSDCLQTGNRKH
jgi:hypothetical protein